MKEKISYDKLYVACGVFEDEYEEEVWEQYVTMGSVRHTIFVNPKRVLIYSKTGDDGIVKYYNYKTGEEVTEKNFKSSFYTTSSPTTSLYCAHVHGLFNISVESMRKEFDDKFTERVKGVGYFIPFDEYMEDRLGVSIRRPSLLLASKLVSLTNVGCGKTFPLSQDEDKANEQLASIGYHTDFDKTMSKTTKK